MNSARVAKRVAPAACKRPLRIEAAQIGAGHSFWKKKGNVLFFFWFCSMRVIGVSSCAGSAASARWFTPQVTGLLFGTLDDYSMVVTVPTHHTYLQPRQGGARDLTSIHCPECSAQRLALLRKGLGRSHHCRFPLWILRDAPQSFVGKRRKGN